MKLNSAIVGAITGIAGFLLSAVLAINAMNRVGEDDAVRIESRLSTIESTEKLTASWAQDTNGALRQQRAALAAMAQRIDYMCDHDTRCAARFGPMPVIQ